MSETTIISFKVLLVLVFSAYHVVGQTNKLLKTEVREIGYSWNIQHAVVSDTYSKNGLLIEFVPVSADSLDRFFSNWSRSNGIHGATAYSKDIENYIVSRSRNNKSNPFSEQLLEAVTTLRDSGLISEDEAKVFVKQIYGKDEIFQDDIYYSGGESFGFNPLVVDERYLYTIEMRISNSSEDFQKVYNDFSLISGDHAVRAMKMKGLSDLFKQTHGVNFKKDLLLRAYYMPDTLVVPPNSSFKKYVGFPPFPYLDGILQVYSEFLRFQAKWNVDFESSNIDKEKVFYKLDLDFKIDGYPISDAESLVYLSHPAYRYDPVEKMIYCQEAYMGSPCEISAIIRDLGKTYYGKASFKGIEFLDFSKKRRSTVVLPLKSI